MRMIFSSSTQLGRRTFLKTAASVAATPLALPRRVLCGEHRTSPGERIRVGAIGVGGRATLLLQQLPDSAEIVALSDCNLSRAESFKSKAGGNWPVYQDYRKLLDHKDIDAVIVATGEFQRVLPCIHACQAGKDVYAEKPLTLYVREGRLLVNAVRHFKRVLQVGSQQRSMEINRVACDLIRTGGLGKVLEVRAINYSGAQTSPTVPFKGEDVPSGLDWNMWLNQAAERPYHPDWMSWMRWKDFAGGEMTNWGAHGIDQIQWALGMDGTGPTHIRPVSEGPSGAVAMTYANGVTVNFMIDPGKGPMGGAIFFCEKGKLEINRNKFSSNPPEIAKELEATLDVVEEERKWSDQLALWQAKWHMQNWIDCIVSRSLPVADVEIGHRSVTVCHLANIARAIGRPLQWNPATELFLGDEQANAMLDRPRRTGFQVPTLS
ncbi:MAG: gfo/Idh/MocA family oxidoreductase [Planctomycetota bacterium]|jgi:predicted dehydrogenase|nr:MAG: gfo/Idh/MocA family oxidoreductase [Planctomycetota bacterium]